MHVLKAMDLHGYALPAYIEQNKELPPNFSEYMANIYETSYLNEALSNLCREARPSLQYTGVLLPEANIQLIIPTLERELGLLLERSGSDKAALQKLNMMRSISDRLSIISSNLNDAINSLHLEINKTSSKVNDENNDFSMM